MRTDIRHEPEQQRFVVSLSGGDAVLDYVEQPDGSLDLRHTFTPPALRGQGIAGSVVLFAFDHARANGLKIVPTCPFVRRMLQEHPEYADLVATGDAAE